MSVTPVIARNATDSSTVEGSPSKNHAESIRLRLRSGGGQTNYSFIYFSRPFPLGATIASATLRVYVSGTWPAASRTMIAKRVTASWKQGTLTWNNQPGVTTTNQASVVKSDQQDPGDVWEFDLQAMMQQVADGTPWYGIRLELNDATKRFLWAANAPDLDLKPTLSVTFSNAPDAPTTLSPSGNRAVSISHPVLRFDFSDVGGDTDLDAVQVQINATDTWGAPSFDSGTVVTTEPQLDLATTAYAGLSDGASTFWRVRVRDGSGLWSDWSAAAQFKRESKGTLTITNPAASPNNFVEEATPPVTWSLSVTQKAWQVIIADPTAGDWLYSSGKRTGTDTAHTLPAGILHDNVTYRLEVRAWDTEDREGTPGDPVYYTAIRDFTVETDAGVTSPAGLTATDLAPEPGCQLDWTRASQPDTWTIVRDGKTIESGIEGADLFVSGTSYRYIDRGAAPRTQHTWEVRAVVNGASSPGPTVQETLEPHGIWLSDPDRNLSVMILDESEGTWAMEDAAENFYALGSRRPIRITQALRGFAGQVEGIIVTINGTSVDTWESRLMRMKETPGRTYRLTLSNLSLPVIVGNLVVSPLPQQEVVKRVSFDFWQVGDFPFRATL